MFDDLLIVRRTVIASLAVTAFLSQQNRSFGTDKEFNLYAGRMLQATKEDCHLLLSDACKCGVITRKGGKFWHPTFKRGSSTSISSNSAIAVDYNQELV